MGSSKNCPLLVDQDLLQSASEVLGWLTVHLEVEQRGIREMQRMLGVGGALRGCTLRCLWEFDRQLQTGIVATSGLQLLQLCCGRVKKTTSAAAKLWAVQRHRHTKEDEGVLSKRRIVKTIWIYKEIHKFSYKMETASVLGNFFKMCVE